ncbi:MAG TPA: SDR family oxidoreductase [Allosphingosinicella sp.]|jgi:NAD(P)-dependent dehydrogenase (short-subunit alcohol dehydrogenase family)
MYDFSSARILVTGAASGIGAAVAMRLAKGNARKLILIDRDTERLSDLGFTLPCERQPIVGDVADEELWARADLTGLTHAVVNAGIGGAGTAIADMSFDDWRRVIRVNLDGAFLTLQAALKAIRSTGSGGAIVITGSAAGIRAEPGTAAYGASKAAVIHLARIAAKEAAADGIRVNAIAPGGVETPIWTGVPFFDELVQRTGSEEGAYKAIGSLATPLGRFATADEIAGQVAFLLSEEAGYMTGACLVADGGYSL